MSEKDDLAMKAENEVNTSLMTADVVGIANTIGPPVFYVEDEPVYLSKFRNGRFAVLVNAVPHPFSEDIVDIKEDDDFGFVITGKTLEIRLNVAWFKQHLRQIENWREKADFAEMESLLFQATEPR